MSDIDTDMQDKQSDLANDSSHTPQAPGPAQLLRGGYVKDTKDSG